MYDYDYTSYDYYFDGDSCYDVHYTDAEGYATDPYYCDGEYTYCVSDGDIDSFDWCDAD